MADQIQITLDDPAMVEFVRSKVRSGEFASEAEAVADALTAWREGQEELARWEREVIVAAHDRIMADPSSGIPIEEVMQRLDAARTERLKAS